MSDSAGQEISGPVRILSDLHMAHSASEVLEVEMLRPLLEGVEKVVFNGDTCEQLYSGWTAQAERMRRELVGLCDGLGVVPVFLRGNHDPHISDCGWLLAAGGKVMITHGDLVLRSPSPWSRESLRRKDRIREILRERGEGDGSLRARWEILQEINAALVPEVERVKTRRIGAAVLSAIWPPERFYQILRAWALMRVNAEAFVTRFAPECEVLIFGHFHRAAIMPRGDRLLCNTGAFTKKISALVVDVSDSEVVVRKVVKTADEFRPGEVVQRRAF